MEALLRERCAELGLKTTGSGEVLSERLENYREMAELRRQMTEAPALSRKRKALSKEEQAALDHRLRKAARRGGVAEVLQAIADGARVNSFCPRKPHQTSPLIAACRRDDDWGVAAAIVDVLIEHGASIHQPSSSALYPLHWAAGSSSAQVVEKLLENGASVSAADELANTPLHAACSRDDDEAAAIVHILIDRFALPEAINIDGVFPLDVAAQYSTLAVCDILLAQKHGDPLIFGIESERERRTLIGAAHNILHGAAIADRILCARQSAGRDPAWSVMGFGGGGPMRTAFNRCNVGVVDVFCRWFPDANWAQATAKPLDFNNGGADPLAAIDKARSLCITAPAPDEFKTKPLVPLAATWAYLRRTVVDVDHVFSVMGTCEDALTWYWVGSELLQTRHAATGRTLLHLAAQNANRAAVHALTRLWINPFIYDAWGNLPSEVTTDPEIRTLLETYARQGPRGEVVRWYGPFFAMRARAWLLCVLRWRQNGTRHIPKDIAIMIVCCLMELEHT
jgi:ankyrin repeat protein